MAQLPNVPADAFTRPTVTLIEAPFPRDGFLMYGLGRGSLEGRNERGYSIPEWPDARYQTLAHLLEASALAETLLRALVASGKAYVVLRDHADLVPSGRTYDARELAGRMLAQAGIELGYGHRRYLVGRPRAACRVWPMHERRRIVIADEGWYVCATCEPGWRPPRKWRVPAAALEP